MKFIIELILTTIIIFFVWNILKRLFLGVFYRNLTKSIRRPEPQNKPEKKAKKSNINWDAETVDYEEISDESGKEK